MWELEFRQPPTGLPIQAPVLDPVGWSERSEHDVSREKVLLGNTAVEAGEIWTIRKRSPTEPTVRLLGDWASVDDIGARLGGGAIHVEGNAGLHLGEGMTGGVITVHGDADDYAGRDMVGGRIHIKGNAGREVGSASIGAKLGMTGGAILVEGSVGEETGRKMRRGTIAVGGSCGDYLGLSMIAGTILVWGAPGRHAGSGMKRGTIAYLNQGAIKDWSPLPTFQEDGVFSPLFLGMYFQTLRRCGFPFGAFHPVSHCLRWRGDLLELGKGEILVASSS
jgi:formylmethanofuran dehydrogenase subunit C